MCTCSPESTLHPGFDPKQCDQQDPFALEHPPGVACSENGFRLKESRFRLGSRKKFLTVRLMRLWNQMPREVVKARSVEVFKVRFDGALSSLMYPFPLQGIWN